MSFSLTKQDIKRLCGRTSYERGEAFYRTRKVEITHMDWEHSLCEATVKGSYQVKIEIDHVGKIVAACSCPTLDSYDHHCQHIAAVLLNIQELEQVSGWRESAKYDSRTAVARTTPGDSSGDLQLTQGILRLFRNHPERRNTARQLFDTRETVAVEFTVSPVSYGIRKHMFGVALKVGPKRLYMVQKIKEFLECLERREPYAFSKHFTYDPQQHLFDNEDNAVIQKLLEVYQYEKMIRESTQPLYMQGKGVSTDRVLLIPPVFWESLFSLLQAAKQVQLEQGGRSYAGIDATEEPLPLQFAFDQAEQDSYVMDMQGLDRIIVMESYGLVLTEGKVVQLPADQCKRLAEMKRMVDAYRKPQITIAPEQIEPFLEQVIPGLKKLGSVRIANAVSERIIQAPLQAKLYLDRLKDRLLVGLEFQYGEIVINPFEEESQKRRTDRIHVRDGEKERQIVELIEQSPFVKTEGGYVMEEEEAEYHFLYHVVPQLEKLAKVYATTAVKERVFTGSAPPQIRVDADDRINWLEVQFDMEGIPESHIRRVLQSLEEKRKYYRLPNGALLPLEATEYQVISDFLHQIGADSMEFSGAGARLPLVRGLHLLDQEHGKTVKIGKTLRRLLEHMRNPDHLDFPVPESLENVLRDYQKYGYQWMKTLAHYQFGGILADDMGLGKTLQSIAFLLSVLPEIREEKQPALIVAPSSLVYNWRNELQKFAPDIRMVIIDGAQAERKSSLDDSSGADVLITSYPLLRKDSRLYAEKMFHTLILDEAQTFKNHATQTAQAVKAMQARYRFALSGTPIENRLEELWSIFDAVFPGLFPARKGFNDLSREAVAKRARPFLLRRVKTDVLKELPEKIETLQASELLPEQKKLYLAHLALLQKETMRLLNADDFQRNRIKILAGLTRLRQLCCHPALFVDEYEGSSAKFEQLLELLAECRNVGRRVLVYSQFTQMLDLIGRELGYQGIPYFYLDGQTPARERVELCNRFNEGERDLFLLSLKAGGTGLNLTGADTVILYDLWWNPAVEQQAADRAHRIGQKKVVHVIRLVTQGTVEEKMFALQQKKKNLIEEVIQPGQEALSSLTEQEIREILMID
ncbi:DEAD/DEAH box helicase [Brevibacillus migulae]|uniref:DEAD/DEAH box helicase n=1 Tax=Brevibacillus migulae TaxID=1644114 RepID=UPI00106DF27F|nr:DEAD/DEAH box helicase [Brevibacillus migulae]